MRARTRTLEVGVGELDVELAALFDAAARFAAAIQEREPAHRLEELFAFLVEYALDRFAAEERTMRAVGYPRLGQHMEEHALFRRQLASLVSQWNGEGASHAVVVASRGFLEHWLAGHITESDVRVDEYLRGLRH